MDVGRGDEVVTQANTCIPTVAAIERTGARPILCDVHAGSATIDPESLRAAVGPGTRAIVPVHLYGQVGSLADVLQVAGERDIPVVEDCAQAHLATDGERYAGTLGAFSFYPTKNLGAIGDGGAVVCHDEELAGRLRRLRVYGQSDRDCHSERGVNSRLDELQAALLRVKVPHLAAWHERRNAIARRYDVALRDTPARPLERLPAREHAYHLYVVRVPERDAFRAALEQRGVGTLIHYPRPVHGHAGYRDLDDGRVSLTRSERLAGEIASLPMFPELKDSEVDRVAEAAREAAFGHA